MITLFHDELRNKYPDSVILVVVERNLGFNADGMTRSVIAHDRRQLTYGLTENPVTMQSTHATIAYGMWTALRVPYWLLFQDIVDRNHWNYAASMISLTAYSLQTTFKNTHTTPTQARDHMRKRLEAQLTGLKRFESNTTNPMTQPRVTVSSHIDFQQKRMPGHHDDCAMVVSFTCYAYRQMARGKLMCLKSIEGVRRALIAREFPNARAL